MLVETTSILIANARTGAELDAIAAAIIAEWGAGGLDDAGYGHLAGLIETRRTVFREAMGKRPGQPRLLARISAFPAKIKARVYSSAEKAARIRRGREQIAPRWMPRHLVGDFSEGEMAVLSVVAGDVAKRGFCDRSLKELADMAGRCVTTARNAIQRAAALGLVSIQERRQRGARNLTNIVRVVHEEWTNWLKRAARLIARGGSNVFDAINTKTSLMGKTAVPDPKKKGLSREESGGGGAWRRPRGRAAA